LLRKERNPRQ